MDKKDIYEHLAKIYLDASSKRNKKTKAYPPVFKNPFFISITIVFVVTILLFIVTGRNRSVFTDLNQNKPVNYELALVLQPDIVKINFNFESVKEEIYSINLNKLNLARFKALAFSIRKANYENKIILKLEFINTVNQRSETYINDMPSYKWQDCRINLAEFKDISDWSKMLNLSFIVGEKNTDKKNGIVYIDNVRLLR
jgi:hypothetical protein